MEKKSGSWSFKKLSKELLSGKFSSSSFCVKPKRLHIHTTTIVDTVVFKIVSVVEGVVIVSTLCVFYLCCGCHF
ncbi:hypothetical protein VNO78_27481 [Psophocarpus tetragonolobus]|uniref:Uncharacterized protein n=1 Tax=Psophocarpus tetragonolobus TaxID=3891 RepID=A0AAN9S0S6_PSOTE